MNRGTEALIEQDGSEGPEVIEDPHVEYASDSSYDADSDDWDDSTEGSGWFADPSAEGQERYYDGHEWTSETRPVDSSSDADSDADSDSDDWADSTEGSGWFADPSAEGQERYYDGREWTSETRPVDSSSDADSDADSDSDDWADSTEGSGWFADPSAEGQERYYDGHEWTSETRLIDSGGPESHLPDHAGELQRALAAATDDIDEVEDRLGNLFERIEHRDERGGRAAKKKKADRDVAEAPADDDEYDEDEVWLREDDDRADGEAEAAPYLYVAEATADVDEVDDEDEEWLLDDDDDDIVVVDGATGAAPDLHVAEAPAGDDEDEEWLLDDADDEVDWQAKAEPILDGDDDDAWAELDEALASEEPEKMKRGLFRRS